MLYDESRKSFILADDRTIIWVYDERGCMGKFKFVNWMCLNHGSKMCKITYGSISQLRSSVLGIGARVYYFVDVPRTFSRDDNMDSILAVFEDMKI
jgi:hypothetical protein